MSAKDRATNKEQSMTISGQSTLPKEDIDRMVKDAEAHAEEDRKRRDEAEVRNNADTLVYQTEKVLREQGENVSAEERGAVEQPLADLKKALDSDDVAAINVGQRDADVGESGVQPEALRGCCPRPSTPPARRRRARTGGASGAGSVDDDEIVDAEVVEDATDDDSTTQA